jgi:hypothetical protein
VLDGSSATLSFKAADGLPHTFKAQLSGAPGGSKFELQKDGRLTLRLPAIANSATFEIALWSGTAAELPRAITTVKPPISLAALTKGGPAHWGTPLETKGKLSDKVMPTLSTRSLYPTRTPTRAGCASADTISSPTDNGSGEHLRRCVDRRRSRRKAREGDLEEIRHGPLSAARVQGRRWKIYVLGRDQITRLHDLNNDGEADWYECFNNDCVVTDNYHEFALDLITDRAGNFYYAKGSPWEPTVTSPHQGA